MRIESKLALSLAIGCATATVVSSAAMAQNYPTRSIRYIVPFPPGGSPDIVGRLISAKLAERMNVQVVVDNRGGAGGIIGSEIAARAAPDGHTLLMIDPALAVAQNLLEKPGFDPLKVGVCS